MAQPFDYTIASPLDAFQKSYAFTKAAEDRQRAEQQREATLKRARDAQAALQSISVDRTPENIARNLLLFPELKEQVTTSEAILSEGERNTANQLRAEVISLFKSGKPELARARLEAQAQAYANTPGKEKEAQAAQTLLKSFDLNPDAVLLPMSIQLAQSDEKLYKNLFDGDDLDKDYKLNLQLYGKDEADLIRRGQQLAKGYVTATGPAGTTYTWAGDLKPATAAGTAAGPAPTTTPTPAPAQVSGPVFNYSQAKAALDSLGADGAVQFMNRNGYRVRVQTPQEARSLPKGTKLILPDGSYGEVK